MDRQLAENTPITPAGFAHQDGPRDYATAKAQFKAAKAFAKAQRPWFRKKWFILPGAVAVIIAGSVAARGLTSSDTSSDAATSAPAAAADKSVAEAPAADAAGVGDKVRDGDFEFTVTKVKPGVTKIGDDMLGTKAQGQFVLVSLTVTNIGDEPQTLLGDNQYLYIDGKQYSVDTAAALYLEDSQTFIEEINPGNTLRGVLVFDVPKSVTSFDKIELHDSAFSGGVEINLASLTPSVTSRTHAQPPPSASRAPAPTKAAPGQETADAGWPAYPGEAALGDRGPHVRAWQDILIRAGMISDIPANHDGYYGPGMLQAVLALQESWGWNDADGIAGPNTYAKIVSSGTPD